MNTLEIKDFLINKAVNIMNFDELNIYITQLKMMSVHDLFREYSNFLDHGF
jgi:hypothetical protein